MSSFLLLNAPFNALRQSKWSIIKNLRTSKSLFLIFSFQIFTICPKSWVSLSLYLNLSANIAKEIILWCSTVICKDCLHTSSEVDVKYRPPYLSLLVTLGVMYILLPTVRELNLCTPFQQDKWSSHGQCTNHSLNFNGWLLNYT